MSSEKTLLQANRFTVVEINAPGGPKQVIRHPGSVVIIPLLEDNSSPPRQSHVCLIQNVRHGVGKTLLEFPAGTREPDEDPAITAVRELTEETGYTATTWQKLAEFYACPGISDEYMHVFLATGCTAGEPDLEADEEIENKVVPLEELRRLVGSGDIIDGKTIVSLYFLDRWLADN